MKLQDEGRNRLSSHRDKLIYLFITVKSLASLRHALLNMQSPTSDVIISPKYIASLFAHNFFTSIMFSAIEH